MGLFQKIAAGLSKTRESFVKEIKGVFGKGKLTEDILESLEEKLISADIEYAVAHQIIDGVRKKARGLEIDQDQLLHWLAEITSELLPDYTLPPLAAKPFVILLIGVNGAGKTTSIAKLAHYYQSLGKSVLLAAGDTFRAGAVAQLEVWAKRVGVDMIKHGDGADAAAVIFDSYAAAKARNVDILIVDTAGRLHTKNNLMDELRKIIRVLKKHDETLPHQALLVIDGNTGQNAIAQGRGFEEVVKLDGLVVTKLDGTAKGGAVLSIVRELKIPVAWLGVGEGLDDFVPFSKKEYVQGLFFKDETN